MADEAAAQRREHGQNNLHTPEAGANGVGG
jgi:hypothetical protein